MINKKLTTKVLGMILAATVLSGCGSQNPGSAQAQEAEAVVEASVEVAEAATEATVETVEEKATEEKSEAKEEAATTATTEDKSEAKDDKASDEASKEASKETATDEYKEASADNAKFEKLSDKVSYLWLKGGEKGKLKTDINCDGVEEELLYDCVLDNNELVDELTLTIDGKKHVVNDVSYFDTYATSVNLFWFNTPEGQYMYFQSMTDNDCTEIGVYTCGDGDYNLVKTLGGEVYFDLQDENDNTYYVKPTNPEDFMIYTSEYIFGTQRYTQRFRVGQNGIPEVIDGYRNYVINHYSEVTTLKTIPTIWIQDKYASIGEAKSIPSGTKVIAVGSNGQSFIDFQVPGTEGIYRVNIEETGIDDYFDRYALTKADGLKGSRRFSDCFEGLAYCD